MYTEQAIKREIKFRAWDKANKEWIYKFGVDSRGTNQINNIIYPYDRDMSYPRTVNNEWVIMQFTGLKDKNGKEGYEGDIVKTDNKGSLPVIEDENRVIEFRDGCWCFNAGRYDNGDFIRFGFWTASNNESNQLKQIEIIGNVFEHPNLLASETK